MEDSDLVLWLGEPSQGPHNLAAKVVRIAPKSDLGSPNPHGCDLTLSALTGEGMLQLQTLLMDRARALLPREGEYALNKRQRVALASLQTELESAIRTDDRSEAHTSELQSLMRISYAVFCLTKKQKLTN